MSPRILITGSRDWTDVFLIERALMEAFVDLGCDTSTILVEGGAKGADLLAAELWRGPLRRGVVEEHPADWENCAPWCKLSHRRRRPDADGNMVDYCPSAGIRRNQMMVNLGADVCLAFIKDNSRGASHAAKCAEKAGIPVRYFRA